jgi:hypothetical protein
MTDRISFQSAGAVRNAMTDRPTISQLDHVDIVFDGPPGPDGPRFVEVENAMGQSIKFGEWVDGFTVLRFRNPDKMARLLTTLRKVETYLEERQDADDGIPNEAMSLLVEVRGAIANSLPVHQRS